MQQVYPDFAWFWEKKEVAQYWIWWVGRGWKNSSSFFLVSAQANQSEQVWATSMSAVSYMLRLSLKMLWSDPNEIPNLCATSWILLFPKASSALS